MSIDGAAAAVCDHEGKFSLESVKPGNHKIDVQLEKFEFDTADFMINSENSILKPISPVRFQLCAYIEDGEGKIEVSQNGQIIKTGPSHACFIVANGEYHVSAKSDSGIYFTPAQQTVFISDSPTESITFTKFTRPFEAIVACVENCDGFTASLKHVSRWVTTEKYHNSTDFFDLILSNHKFGD